MTPRRGRASCGRRGTAEREDLYAQAIKIVWSDAVGMFPMFVEQPYAWRNTVEGFEPSAEAMPYFTRVTVSGD